MREMHWRLASIGVLAFSIGAIVAACSNGADDCEENRTCAGGTGAGLSGSSGGTPDACIPGPNGMDPGDKCGIFLAKASGDDNNGGTKGAPVATFQKAIELAAKDVKRIYVCNEQFDEAVTVPAGFSIFGGLDCAGTWKYVGNAAKTTIAPGPDKIPLTLESGEGTTHIADLTVKAADAMAPGGSSIAAVADSVTAEFVRSDFLAGAARDGENGAMPPDPVEPSDPTNAAIRGNDGLDACTSAASDNAGGAAKANPVCDTSVGGAGGTGMVAAGGNGVDGKPLPDPNPEAWGLGGQGAAAGPCKNGGPGLLGADGAVGTGALELGTLTKMGFVGEPGTDGTSGAPGQGGGGGGAAKGKAGCGGASGGGGGAGGCGGAGGKGGQGGGSSIAIISLNATLTFTEVTLKVGAAGKGGDGGAGQSGGAGGVGGLYGKGLVTGTTKGCSGGEGGNGGAGGPGGGGRGGHAVGVAHVGAAPSIEGVPFEAGTEGKGGVGVGVTGNGADGVQAKTQAFEAPHH